MPRLQQRDREAGRGPVYSGGGQFRTRWVEGGTRQEGAKRGWILGILEDKHSVNNASCQKHKRFMSYERYTLTMTTTMTSFGRGWVDNMLPSVCTTDEK